MTTPNFRKVNNSMSDFPGRGDMPIDVRSRPLVENSAFTASRSLSSLLEVYHPFLFYEYRLQSFTPRWPHTACNLSPEKMARAGFFYNPGKDDDLDNVACPFCLKELTGWEPNDDPIVEHSKRRGCYFTRLRKCERDFTEKAYVSFVESMETSSETASDCMMKQSNMFHKFDKGKNATKRSRKKNQRK